MTPGDTDGVVVPLAQALLLRKTVLPDNRGRQVTNPIIDGEIRDGRHHMLIRVYYEDTDFVSLPPFWHSTKRSSAIFRRADCSVAAGELL